jgi:hypothetical protein
MTNEGRPSEQQLIAFAESVGTEMSDVLLRRIKASTDLLGEFPVNVSQNALLCAAVLPLIALFRSFDFGSDPDHFAKTVARQFLTLEPLASASPAHKP